MRIVFDMDGTITEGRFLEPPRTRDMYMALEPYDRDTMLIWNTLADMHELYIITARSDERADMDIVDWFYEYGMIPPTAVITNPFPGRKNPENAIWKADLVALLQPQLMFDDSPHVWRQCGKTYLMDNPYWEENQNLLAYNRVKSWKEIGAIIESYNNRESHESQASV